MTISKEDKMIHYRNIIPRLGWFTPFEQESLVFQASFNAIAFNADFFGILANLTFMKSIQEGKKPALDSGK